MSISSKLAQPLFRLGCMSILVLVILVGFNFGEGVRAKDQQASSLVEVKAAIPKNFPPQYFLDKKGQPQGFAIDVLNQVAEKMGIRVVYQVEDDWNEVLEALRQDRVDLIPNLGVTPVRKADFAFTSTIETFPVSIFVRRSTFRIRQVKDLSGKSVAVVKKNAGVNLLQDKGIELEVVETPEQALFELLSGRVEAIVYPEPVLLRVARKARVDKRIKIVGQPLKEIKRAVAVSKDNTHLLAQFDEAIKTFVQTTTYREIYVKWYGQPTPFWTVARTFWIMSLLLLLIVINLIGWRANSLLKLNHRLLKNIEQRQRAETELERFFELSIDLFCVAGTDNYFKRLNPAFEKTLGYTPEELFSQPFVNFIHPDDRAETLSEIEKLSSSQPTVSFENRYRCQDGSYKWLAWNAFPVTCENLIYAVARDITEKKLAEKALRLTQFSVDRAADAIFWIDRNAQFTYVNEAACQSLGYSRSELLLMGVPDIDPNFPVSAWAQHWQEVKLKQAMTFESIHQNKAGACFPVEVRLNYLVFDEQQYLCAFAHDITRRKQTEKLLADYNHTLEYQVAERTQELSQALKQLQATQTQLVESKKMAALGSLVAGVAHEINTPLGIGVTASSTLAEKTQEFDQIYRSGQMKRSQMDKFLHTASQSSSIILSNLNRAAELIQSFKQVAVDQSSESRRTFKLKEYLEETLTALRPKFKGTKHSIEIRGDESLLLDSYPGALSQIVTNLVINSLIHAYSAEDRGFIVIDFQVAGAEIILSYTDDGQGISPETKEKIFDPFFTTKRGQGGSGLGLHLVYNLVTQKLQGTIACESKVGFGTKFTITLPSQIS